jgi:excinuclease ABC subunit A
VLQTFANTESASMKKRVARYMVSTECPLCRGKRLRQEALSVTFAGIDITDISRMPLARLACAAASPTRRAGGQRQGARQTASPSS